MTKLIFKPSSRLRYSNDNENDAIKDVDADKKLASEDSNIINVPTIIEDVIFESIFPRLQLSDLMNFRSASRRCRALIDDYLEQWTRIIIYDANNYDEADNICNDAKDQKMKKLTTDANKTLTSDVDSLKLVTEITKRGCIVIKNDKHSVICGRRSFEVISRRCFNLRELHLNGCKFITDDILISVLNKCCLKLTLLDISNTLGISNKSFENGIKKCSNLNVLILKDCHWINEETIGVITSSLPYLSEINLSSCWQITDEEITKLITKCTKLSKVTLSNIYSITDQSLIRIADNASSSYQFVSYLNISNCWRLTDKGINHLSLKILNDANKNIVIRDEIASSERHDADQMRRRSLSGQGSSLAKDDGTDNNRDKNQFGVCCIDISHCSLITETLINSLRKREGLKIICTDKDPNIIFCRGTP